MPKDGQVWYNLLCSEAIPNKCLYIRGFKVVQWSTTEKVFQLLFDSHSIDKNQEPILRV